MSAIDGKRIVLGVSGGIAAYKAADFASKLVQSGAEVDVIMTPSAVNLVGPATFQALTKRPVFTDVFTPWTTDWFGHITLGHEADAIVIAPATANTIARLAHGLADNMLGAVVLSTRAPILVAPAMEHEMYHHPATQANLKSLVDLGVIQIGPESGRLASGEIGDGRMSPPDVLVSALRMVLGRSGSLAGRSVVITAGGTREPLDPIRFIGNRSSGRMGHALAQAGIDAGARVTLVSTANDQPDPYGATMVRVQTAEEMFSATAAACDTADALIMSAAVADFRPRDAESNKIKKSPETSGLSVELVRNPDIVASINRKGLVKIGFAAETENLLEHATVKLRDKGLDMIVANDAETTIGADASTAHFIFANRDPLSLPRMPKWQVARLVIDEVARLSREASFG